MSAEYLAELIAFLVMTVVIAWYAWPRLMRLATAQQDRIAAALDEAEKGRAEVAAAVEESRRQLAEAEKRAEAIIAQARKVAQDDAAEARRRSDEEVKAFLVQATTQISAERDKAVQELRRETGRLVVDAAGRAIASSLTADGHRRLVDDGVARLAGGAPDSN